MLYSKIAKKRFFSCFYLFSSDLRVACFKIADQFEDLHDFTRQVKLENTNEVVKKCAKLAKEKNYTMFALAEGGVCFSRSDMREKYLDGGTINAECRHGIGMGNSMFVYSLGKYCQFVCFLVIAICNIMHNLFEMLPFSTNKYYDLLQLTEYLL